MPLTRAAVLFQEGVSVKHDGENGVEEDGEKEKVPPPTMRPIKLLIPLSTPEWLQPPHAGKTSARDEDDPKTQEVGDPEQIHEFSHEGRIVQKCHTDSIPQSVGPGDDRRLFFRGDDLASGVEAANAHHAAAGMRPRAAKIQPLHGRTVSGHAGKRPQ